MVTHRLKDVSLLAVTTIVMACTPDRVRHRTEGQLGTRVQHKPASPASAKVPATPPPTSPQGDTLRALLNAGDVRIKFKAPYGNGDGDGDEWLMLAYVEQARVPIGNPCRARKSDNYLMIVQRKESGGFGVRACSSRHFTLSSNPYVIQRDLNGDSHHEVILTSMPLSHQTTTGSTAVIRVEADSMAAVRFSGGCADGADGVNYGALELVGDNPVALRFHYGPGRAFADTYVFDGRQLRLRETTARRPTQWHQRVIDALDNVANVNVAGAARRLVVRVEFYPGDKVLVGAEDGHTDYAFVARYRHSKNGVLATSVDDNRPVVELRKVYALDVGQAVSYFRRDDRFFFSREPVVHE